MVRAHTAKEWVEVGAYVAFVATWLTMWINAIFFRPPTTFTDDGEREPGDW